MNPTFLLWLAGAMAVFISAATASRAYIATSNILILVLSLGLYCVGNLMMVRLMREGGLGLAISASAIVQLILVNIIAFAVFGERLSLAQLAGIGLGIVAMALMLLPMQGKA
jgi:small multidrug resistance pump